MPSDPMREYLRITAYFFKEYQESVEAIRAIIRSSTGGYIPLQVYLPDDARYLIYILRHLALFIAGGVGIGDEIEVGDRLLTEANKQKVAQLSFELNAKGDVTKSPILGDVPSTNSYFTSLVNAFGLAVRTPGASIDVLNRRIMVSDGTQWIPYTKSAYKHVPHIPEP